MRFIWLAVLLCAIGSGVLGMAGIAMASGAPQEAAAAAMAAAGAVIPYCFARACQALSSGNTKTSLEKIASQLEIHTRLLASMANDITLAAPPTKQASDMGEVEVDPSFYEASQYGQLYSGHFMAVAAAACLLGNDAVRCGKRQTLAPVPKPTLGVVAYNGTAKAFTQSQVGKQDKSRRIEGV